MCEAASCLVLVLLVWFLGALPFCPRASVGANRDVTMLDLLVCRRAGPGLASPSPSPSSLCSPCRVLGPPSDVHLRFFGVYSFLPWRVPPCLPSCKGPWGCVYFCTAEVDMSQGALCIVPLEKNIHKGSYAEIECSIEIVKRWCMSRTHACDSIGMDYAM